MAALEIVYRVARQFDSVEVVWKFHELESELGWDQAAERIIRQPLGNILSFARLKVTKQPG